MFAESQDYGIHGERVKNACWGYLCQSGAVELREVNIFCIFFSIRFTISFFFFYVVGVGLVSFE